MRKLLTYKEAAEYLQVSEKTLRNWVCQRKIGIIKFGNTRSAKVRFRQEDIEKFIQKSFIQPIVG